MEDRGLAPVGLKKHSPKKNEFGMNASIYRGTMLSRTVTCRISRVLLLVVALGAWSSSSRARAEETLIYRPAEQVEQTVTTPSYEFHVNISAFASVEEVRINGKVVAKPNQNFVALKHRLKLKPGRNQIEVVALVRKQSVRQVFPITLKLPKKAEAYLGGGTDEPEAGFHLVALLGVRRASNSTLLPADLPAQPGTRGVLLLVPSYDHSISKNSTLRAQGILSRERYQNPEQAMMAVQFTQFAGMWLKGAPESGQLQMGLGINAIDQKYRTLIQGDFRVENDQFASLGYQKATSGGTVWNLGLEAKRLDKTTDSLDKDRVEDARVFTANTKLESDLMGGRGKASVQIIRNHAEGRYARTKAMQFSLEQSYALGNFIPVLSYRRKEQRGLEKDPLMNARPRSRVTGLSFLGNYSLTPTWFLMLEAGKEHGWSNISSYSNTTYGLSVVYLY